MLPAMAGEAEWITQVREIRADPIETNLQFEKIESILLQHGKAWFSNELAEVFLPHPGNRGGSMVNWHDMHQKGAIMLRQGVRRDLIKGEVCFEMPRNEDLRKRHLAKIQKLVDASQGASAHL